MDKTVVSVSLEKELLEKIDKVAEKEEKTRSEILGYAADMYLERKNKWERLFAYGDSLAEKYGITEEVIAEEIRLYREEKRRELQQQVNDNPTSVGH